MRTESKWSLVCVVLMALLTPAALALDFPISGEPEPEGGYIVNGILDDWNIIRDATVTFQVGSVLPTGAVIETKDDCNVHFKNCDFEASTFLLVAIDDADPTYNGIVTFHGVDFAVNGVSVPADATSIAGADLDGKVLSGYFANGDELEYFEIYVMIFHEMSVSLVGLDGPSVIDVVIDIKPDSADNTINLGSMGVISVGILSTADFDATQVDPWTVELAGSGVAVRGKGSKLLSSIKDLNGDGLMDLDVKVETENLDPNSFQDGAAILTGQTYDGLDIQGSDIITIVPVE